MSDILTADVVIVGSGVAGAMTGHALARAGVKVLILEAGPRVDRAKAVIRFRNSPTKGANSPYPADPKVPQPDLADIGAYYVQAGPVTFNGLQARVVGGTTWHWGGLTLRYRPNDFRLKSKFGVGVDWPLSYDDLEPWYAEAERQIGVCGPPDYDWGSPRSTPYPMPPIAPSYLDTVIGAACGKVGLTLGTFPHGRNSVGFDDRPPCCGNASCVPICPIGAKYDGAVHVAKAESRGRARRAARDRARDRRRRRPQGHRDPLQAARRLRARGARQGLRRRRARDRDREAAADVGGPGEQPHGREQQRPGRAQPADAARRRDDRPHAREALSVSRSGRDVRHPRAARRRLPRHARRVRHVAVERGLGARARSVQARGEVRGDRDCAAPR